MDVKLPMHLHVERMPDEPTTQAILYGPLVLAGKLPSEGLTEEMTVGEMGPDVPHHPTEAPTFRNSGGDIGSWVKRVDGETIQFKTSGQERNVTLVPFNKVASGRYSIYWTVS